MTATMPSSALKSAATPAVSPDDVIRKARDAGVQMLDVRFCDLPGQWQHFSMPIKELQADIFSDGLGFDVTRDFE